MHTDDAAVTAHTPKIKQRISYLARSLRSYAKSERFRCPSCSSRKSEFVKRKLLVTALVRCLDCRLLYRVPTDDPGRNFDFYQNDYSVGFTTDLPDKEKLQALTAAKFAGTERSYAERITLLQALGVKPPSRVFEYGASWGYGAWQFADAGYSVVGFEISQPRARYAREMLNVSIHDKLEAVAGGGQGAQSFDVFFSSHVLEHVPSVAESIEWARRLIRPGGLFVAFTPNGSFERMRRRPEYHKQWGDVHGSMLDDEFYMNAFAREPKLLASDPYDLQRVRAWDRKSDAIHDLSGDELLLAAVL